MAIFVDKNTKVLVQGITGRDGLFHAKSMAEYGTMVVGGVTPGKGGQKIDGFDVFDNVAEAVKSTSANTTIMFVPPQFAIDALYEAVDAPGIKLVVCVTEGIPANEMAKIYRQYNYKGVRLIGPNCPGIISPGKAKVGILPARIFAEGPVGVVSRSGTLTYEIVDGLTRAGLGQSTCIGIGGDMIIGTNFLDALDAFERDPETKAIALIGEIGGTDEQDAARFIRENMKKPVVAFIAGQTAPPGKRMGHAGAIIAGSEGTAAEKIAAFKEANVPVAKIPSELPEIMKRILK